MKVTNIKITGTGSYIPKLTITNQYFAKNKFFNEKGQAFNDPHELIAEKFKAITGIEERRYLDDNLVASDMGTVSARLAIEDAGIDQESIDQLIVATNFGNMKPNSQQSDLVPSIASKIKHDLGIKNPACVAYDVIFGCPGWIQGIIQANAYIRSGMAKKCLVVATETLSRIIDKYDRDSMIFSDGAGACMIEATPGDEQEGIIGIEAATWAQDEAFYLFLGKGNLNEADPEIKYMKMHGRKIYQFALTRVPQALKDCLDKSGLDIHDVSKILIHQANDKMNQEIIKRLFRLYKERSIPEGILPMSIRKLGNSSVATVPTLLDQILKGTSEEKHEINKGDIILLASIGAGMNINAISYKY